MKFLIVPLLIFVLYWFADGPWSAIGVALVAFVCFGMGYDYGLVKGYENAMEDEKDKMDEKHFRARAADLAADDRQQSSALPDGGGGAP